MIARIARALASPAGVLVALPALVVAAGSIVLLLGRTATRDATDSLARRQLAAQADTIQHEVALALDQAEPMLARLRALADPALPIEEVAERLVELQTGRPGVVNVSIGFPSGGIRGTYLEGGELRVQESVFGAGGTQRTNYAVGPTGVHAVGTTTTDYDVRTRGHYILATQQRRRAWTPPRVYFTSHTTGITCVEPVLAGGELRAVATVDFDVGALSQFVHRAPLDGARTAVFAADGTILAFPTAALPDVATREQRLLRWTDFDDPALRGLFETLGAPPDGYGRRQRFLEIDTTDGAYLASIAPLGGSRAGVETPLDWYVATLVPERVLLGPTQRFSRQSLAASAGALLVALGVAIIFAWNVVRMRRAVGAAREAARSAEARAKELGSYRLVARLGAGGMGEVWRAEHRLLARQAAIKLVRPEQLRDPAQAAKVRERFRREAQTLATMQSRHTIALYDYGVTDDGTFFFVMELLDGVDLDRLVRDRGPQPAARAIHLLVQACQSLAEAHRAGLVHRDIKPANLMTCRLADELDVLKVLDFGIVRAIDELADPSDAISLERYTRTSKLTMHGMMVGTPGYIAPETVMRGAFDERSDIYALGCVAWWLLTGGEVFPRPDDNTALRHHADSPVPPLRARVPGWLPDELEALVLRCLAKLPQDRPDGMHAVAAALRAIAIPDEHAWTEERRAVWWGAQRAPAPEPVGADAPTIIVVAGGR